LAKETAPEPRPVILVADDDKVIVTCLARVLRQAGFDVLEAFDAVTALELCSSHSVSVAIVDYGMPGMNGIEFARLNATQTAVPVIFLSGYSDDEIVGEAIAAGAMTYLVKPVDTTHLLPVIRTALQRSRELNALRTQTQQLNSALQSSRPVNIATGLLMARFQIGQEEAFERLRRQARSRRTRLEEVAAELLRMSDEIDKLYGPLSHGAAGHKPVARGSTTGEF
jgi:AmiR/NasT family two-component response regulator